MRCSPLSSDPRAEFTFLALCCVPLPGLAAQSGSPDPGFGSNGWAASGVAHPDIIETAHCMVVQSDGKIVAVGIRSEPGNTVLQALRFRGDGALDSTGFSVGDADGVDGIFRCDLDGTSCATVSIKQQSSGKLVISGSASDAQDAWVFALRLNANGTLDLTFSAANDDHGQDRPGIFKYRHGSIRTTGGCMATYRSVASSDKMVLGLSVSDSTTHQWGFLRLTKDGELDRNSGFGASNSGVQVRNPPDGLRLFSVACIVLQSDEKPVFAGSCSMDTTSFRMVGRATANGRDLDKTYSAWDGTDGYFRCTGLGSASGLVLQTVNGRECAVTVGYTDDQVCVVRLNRSGYLDTGFNGCGIRLLDASGVGNTTLNLGGAVAVDPQNRLLLSGQVANLPAAPWDFDVFVTRLLVNGSDDTTFHPRGTCILEPFGNGDTSTLDQPYEIAFDPVSQRIVCAGRTKSAGLGGPGVFDMFAFRVIP